MFLGERENKSYLEIVMWYEAAENAVRAVVGRVAPLD